MTRKPLLIAAAIVCLAVPAAAHQSSVSYSHVTIQDDGTVDYTLDLRTRDLYEALSLDKDRDATDDEIMAGQAKLYAYVEERVHVLAGEKACPVSENGVSVVDQNDRFAELKLVAHCPEGTTKIVLAYDLFFDLDPRHEGMLEVIHGERAIHQSFTKGARTFEWNFAAGAKAPSSRGLLSFVHEGVMHIFTGYDHIAFLCSLLLVAVIRSRAKGPGAGSADYEARGARASVPYILKVVTAFTVGHSITLIGAALGWFHVPSRVVESAIAASIIYVAVENVLLREPGHRWPLALGFGLVHGMGFASVLAPMLPPHQVVVPLLALNVGVELGQMAIVCTLFPLLLVGARLGADAYRRMVVVGGSAIVAGVACLWLTERVLSITLLGGKLG